MKNLENNIKKYGVKINVETEQLDEAIKKANRLAEILKGVQQILNSLNAKN